MSTYANKIAMSRNAGADLRTKQFYAVKISNGNVVLCSVAGEPVFGVLDNKPNSGQSASIAVAGAVQGIMGGVVAPGGPVKTNAAGKFIAATAGTTDTSDAGGASDPLVGSHVFGRYMGESNSADGDIAQILITREGAIPTTAA